MMKWQQILKYFILSFLLSGCNVCLNRFYQVHEERKDKYEDIIFNAPGIKCSELLEYTDNEPTTDTAYYEVLGYFNGLELGKNDCIVHFKKDTEEYYCVSIDKDPCEIWRSLIKGSILIGYLQWVVSMKLRQTELEKGSFRQYYQN